MSKGHVVVHGAMCKCKFGYTPDTLVVQSQSKVYVNDSGASTKLVANTMDIGQPFQAKTFGQCKLQPSTSGHLPCMPTLTQWQKSYDKVVLPNNGTILTEESMGMCPVAGSPCVEFTFHGQTGAPGASSVANSNSELQSQLNPLADIKEYKKVTTAFVEEADEDSNFEKEITKTSETNIEYIYYEKNGTYLGGKENSLRIYLVEKNLFDKAKTNQIWSTINIESKAIKLFSNYLSHQDLLEYAGIINGEATHYAGQKAGIAKDELKKERYAISNVIYNFMKSSTSIKKVKDIPLRFAYARKDKTPPYNKIVNSTQTERNNEWVKVAIYAVFNAVVGSEDYSNGATQWDGGDVFTGNYYSKTSKNNYNPMRHYRQLAHNYEARLKGIYDKDDLAKKMQNNLKKYYTKIDTHRAKHLKPLFTFKTRSSWQMLYYEEKSYTQYIKGKLDFSKVKLVDENKKVPKYNTKKVLIVSGGSTSTWVYAGLNCLWEVTAQQACTIFYKEIKKYDKSIINTNEAPF